MAENTQWPGLGAKDPVSAIMEKCKAEKIKIDFLYRQLGGGKFGSYEVSVVIDGVVKVTRQGENKKIAKKRASYDYLQEHFPDVLKVPVDDICEGQKQPISLLNEYAHSRRTQVSFTAVKSQGPSNEPIFTVGVVLEGKTYPETQAGTKHLAKTLAAKIALKMIKEEREAASNSPHASKPEQNTMTFTEVKKSEVNGVTWYHVSAIVNTKTYPESVATTQEGAKNLAIRLADLLNNQYRDSWITTSASVPDVLAKKCEDTGTSVNYQPIEGHGPAHIRIFSTAAVIQSVQYPRAYGLNKRSAVSEAASIAYILRFMKHSFNADELNSLCRPVQKWTESMQLTALPNQVQEEVNINLGNRDPTSALQQYVAARNQQLSFNFHDALGPNQSLVYVDCLVDGKHVATGHSPMKHTAKQMSTRKALSVILNDAHAKLQIANQLAAEPLVFDPQSNYGDYICTLSQRMLTIVQASQLYRFVKEKILATMTMRTGPDDPGVIVSLGTGNRCILGKYLTKWGNKIHHSHAEVVTRRGLVRYLYTELLKFERGKYHKIFMEQSNGKLKIRDNVTFHLFISRPPCGDASTFIRAEPVNVHDQLKSPTQKTKQGVLRCIIEDGEGAIPSTSHPEVADFEGLVNRDKRLRVMTCSDKICSWNVLGLQGALLTHILEPFYLTSLILGSTVGRQPDHIPRAVSQRLTVINPRTSKTIDQELPPGFRLNHPLVDLVSEDSSSMYDLNNSRPFSINWCVGDKTVEVVDGVQGILLDQRTPQPSRISKVNLFKLFKEVSIRLGNPVPPTYAVAKQQALGYRRSKQLLLQYCADLDYGPWVQVPREVDFF